MLIETSGALLQCRRWRQVNMIQVLIVALEHSKKLCLKEMLYTENTKGI